MSEQSQEERCALWDLPVSSCGCPQHRNSVPPPEEHVFGAWTTAKFMGSCHLNRGHIIERGEKIVAVLERQGDDVVRLGWACEECGKA